MTHWCPRRLKMLSHVLAHFENSLVPPNLRLLFRAEVLIPTYKNNTKTNTLHNEIKHKHTMWKTNSNRNRAFSQISHVSTVVDVVQDVELGYRAVCTQCGFLRSLYSPSYATDQFFNNKIESCDADAVLTRGSAVCQGYAELFLALCKSVEVLLYSVT